MQKFTSEIPTEIGVYLAYGNPYGSTDHKPRWGIVEVSLSGNNTLMYTGFGVFLNPKDCALVFRKISELVDITSLCDYYKTSLGDYYEKCFNKSRAKKEGT